MENLGRVDELRGFAQLAGAEVGDGQRVAGVEPEQGAGGVVLHPQPLDVDVHGVEFEPAVGVSEVAQHAVGGGSRNAAPGGERAPGIAIVAGEEQGAGPAHSQLATLVGGQLVVVAQEGQDQKPQDKSIAPLLEVGVGARGLPVEQPDRIDQRFPLRGNAPGGVMALGLAFGRDVPRKLDQCHDAHQPRFVVQSRCQGKLEHVLAAFPRRFRLADRGRELEPCPCQEQRGRLRIGSCLAQTFVEEPIALLEESLDLVWCGADLGLLDLVAVERGDGQPRVEPAGRAGRDGQPERTGLLPIGGSQGEPAAEPARLVSGRIAWEVADLAIEGAGIRLVRNARLAERPVRGRWPGSAASPRGRAARRLPGPARAGRGRRRLHGTGPPGNRRPRRAAATNMLGRPGRSRGRRAARTMRPPALAGSPAVA